MIDLFFLLILKQLLLRDRLFCIALVERLGYNNYDGNVCHYELNYDVLFVVPLFIYLTFYFILLFLFFNRVSINYTEWPMIPACPSLICFVFVLCVCVVVVFLLFFVLFFPN